MFSRLLQNDRSFLICQLNSLPESSGGDESTEYSHAEKKLEKIFNNLSPENTATVTEILAEKAGVVEESITERENLKEELGVTSDITDTEIKVLPVEREAKPIAEAINLSEDIVNNVKYYYESNLTEDNREMFHYMIGIEDNLDMSKLEDISKLYYAVKTFQGEGGDGYPGPKTFAKAEKIYNDRLGFSDSSGVEKNDTLTDKPEQEEVLEVDESSEVEEVEKITELEDMPENKINSYIESTNLPEGYSLEIRSSDQMPEGHKTSGNKLVLIGGSTMKYFTIDNPENKKFSDDINEFQRWVNGKIEGADKEEAIKEKNQEGPKKTRFEGPELIAKISNNFEKFYNMSPELFAAIFPSLSLESTLDEIKNSVIDYQEKNLLVADGIIGPDTHGKMIDGYIAENKQEHDYTTTEHEQLVTLNFNENWGVESGSELGGEYVEWEFKDLNELISVATSNYEGPINNQEGKRVVFRLAENQHSKYSQDTPRTHGEEKKYVAFHKTSTDKNVPNPDVVDIRTGFKNHDFSFLVTRNGNIIQFHDKDIGHGALGALSSRHYDRSFNKSTIAIEMTSRNIKEKKKYTEAVDGDRYVESEEITQDQLVTGKYLAQTLLDMTIIDSMDAVINDKGKFVSEYQYKGETKWGHPDHFNDTVMNYFGAGSRQDRLDILSQNFSKPTKDVSWMDNGGLFADTSKSNNDIQVASL